MFFFLIIGCQKQEDSFCISVTDDGIVDSITIAKYDSIYTQLGNMKFQDSLIISNSWYRNFAPAFIKHIINANIPWDKTVSIWIDLCCSSDGNIERVLYGSRDLTDSNLEEQFCKSVESFASTYTFPVKINKRYSQCGSFRFGPTN